MTDSTRWIDVMRAELGDGRVTVDAEDRAPFETGWRYGQGVAAAVAFPSNVDEVAACMRVAHEHGVRVLPVGANTGLVAASTPDDTGQQLVVSLRDLKAIERVDPIDRVAVVQAGITLEALNAALAEHDLWFPVDLGADPQIGGMVATNTGGTRLLRYGDVRANLLGLEVVLADGSVVSQLEPLRKNNTGLDWKQLFVGTSGTYGLVTRATLSLAPRPRQDLSLLFGVDDGDAVLALLARFERDLGEFLSAFEVIGRAGLEITARRAPRVRDPFPDRRPEHAVLVEFATAMPRDRVDLESVVLGAVGVAADAIEGVDADAVLVEQDGDFWHLRHSLTEALRQEGPVLAFDLSVARPRLADFESTLRARIADRWSTARVCDYGHWGDGGVHVNLVFPDDGSIVPGDATWRAIQDAVYAICVEEFSGSFSAEHGVGPHNQRLYDRYTPDRILELCDALGAHLDPEHRLGVVRWGRPRS